MTTLYQDEPRPFRLPLSAHQARITATLAAFVIFCSYLPSYFFLLGYTTLNPGTVVVGFFGLSALLWFLTPQRFETPVTLVMTWAFAFTTLNVLALLVHGAGVEMYQRIAGALSIPLLAWFVLPRQVSSLAVQRFLLLFAVFNLACVTVDFFLPGLFVPEGSPFYNLGRGAGFFVNANKSGIAAVLVVVMAAFTGRSRLFIYILMVCAAWLLLTLSRSAILAFLAVCFVLLVTGHLRLRDLVGPTLLGSTVALSAIVYFVLEEGQGVASIEERAAWLTSAGAVKDLAADERTIAAQGAISAFLDHPLLGNGFGSANRLHGLPAHNLYLEFAADYGLLGTLFIFAFMLAMYLDWRRAGSPPGLRAPLFAWILATALISFFFDETVGVTPFVFVAAWFQRQLATASSSPPTA